MLKSIKYGSMGQPHKVFGSGQGSIKLSSLKSYTKTFKKFKIFWGTTDLSRTSTHRLGTLTIGSTFPKKQGTLWEIFFYKT